MRVIDMTVFLHHKTPLAILVSEDEDGKKIWLPKSKIEIEDEDIDHGPLNITVPDWLAQDKGMI